jgi:hypothetical protein
VYFTVSDKKRIRRSFREPEGDWRRADLHLHTPASADWQEPGVTYLEWLQKADSRGLDIVAITDHNTVEGIAKLRADIERLAWLEANDRLRPQERRDLDEYRRLGDKILVLPGFEFTATFGFHILAIFPPETALRKLELLLLRLNVPVDRLAEGITEVGASTDVLTAYRLIHEAGGLVIAAHANSTHGVALQGLSFGGQTKIAFTQDPHLHALEVTDLESTSRRATARFFDGSKPEYPRRMHCVQGSDAHRLVRDPKDKNRPGIGDRVTEVLLADTTFEALKAVFEEDDFTRTRPYQPTAEVPFDFVEAAREQGNTIVQSFHESMTREGGRLHKMLCDVVAFANTRGGTVYIGVSAARKGAGRGVENPEGAVSFLKKELERNITPQLDARVDVMQSLGASIVRVSVPNGPDKPYAMGQTRIYVRQEGETNEAMRDELVQLVLAGRQAGTAAVQEPPPAQASMSAVKPIKPVFVAPEPAVVPEEITLPAELGSGELPLPAIGVEIVSAEERKGARYFTIRDLRNGNTVQNVTMASARKLWSYAISQYLTNTVDPARITWHGDFGLWQAARRAKKLRYDLALRQPDAPGGVRVFYGVTADGMTGPWAQFLRAEDRNAGEAEVEVEAETEAEVRIEVEAHGEIGEGGAAEDQPKAGSRRRRPSNVTAKPETEAEAKPRTEAKPKAEAKPRTEAKPKADAKPKVEPKVEIEVKPESPLQAEPSQPAEAKPKTRSRRRKPQAGAEAQVQPQIEVEPPAKPPTEVHPEVVAEAQPKPTTRSRSRKPKAKAEAEPAA